LQCLCFASHWPVLSAFFFPAYGLQCFSTLFDLFHTFPRPYYPLLAKITSELLIGRPMNALGLHSSFLVCKLKSDPNVKLQDVLTNLLVFASQDADLLTSPMVQRLMELQNTGETTKAKAPTLPRQGLKNGTKSDSFYPGFFSVLLFFFSLLFFLY
jgi:hypothetical protein